MENFEAKIAEKTREVKEQADIAKTAQENYKRELNLRRAALTSVREARDELEAEKRLRTNTTTALAEKKKELGDKQLEVDRLTETATRLKDYEATLSGNLERVREELSKERMDKAQQKADAAHYKDKVDRMTRLVADNEKEAKRASEQMLKLQNR